MNRPSLYTVSMFSSPALSSIFLDSLACHLVGIDTLMILASSIQEMAFIFLEWKYAAAEKPMNKWSQLSVNTICCCCCSTTLLACMKKINEGVVSPKVIFLMFENFPSAVVSTSRSRIMLSSFLINSKASSRPRSQYLTGFSLKETQTLEFWIGFNGGTVVSHPFYTSTAP